MLLAQPIKIKNLELRNRIVMPPMATGKADRGAPTQEMVEYYRQRATGTGLIIVEHEHVSTEGMADKNQLSMARDDVIPAYRTLTDAVHAQGAAILAQLSHAGAQARDIDQPTLAPSAVAFKDDMAVPTPMSLEDIDRVVARFAEAAVRAREAGFDGVEIHAAHGYLLNQFYSPLTNRREDDYSAATLKGRTRLHTRIIRAVRQAVGEDYPVAMRYGMCDYREGGSREEDAPAGAKLLADAGLDLMDITGGLFGFMIPGNSAPGWFGSVGRAVRAAIDIPVLVTGGVKTGEDAERLLQSGGADLVGVGRAMLKDANWAQNALV